jgi:hypothetical protein
MSQTQQTPGVRVSDARLEAPDTPQTGGVRYRWSCEILYGRYTDFMDLQREKTLVAKARGWRPSAFWIATAGQLNSFFLEREYDSLDEFAAELAERENDFDFMRLMRASYQFVVQGSVKMELFKEIDPGAQDDRHDAG